MNKITLNVFIGLMAWGLFGIPATMQADPTALDPLFEVTIDDEELKLKIFQDIRAMTPDQLRQIVTNLMLINAQRDRHSADASPKSRRPQIMLQPVADARLESVPTLTPMPYCADVFAKTIHWYDVYHDLASVFRPSIDDDDEWISKISQDMSAMTPDQLKQIVIDLMIITTPKDSHSAGASPNILRFVEEFAKTIQWHDIYRELTSSRRSSYVTARALRNYCLGYSDISQYYYSKLSGNDIIKRYLELRANQTQIEAHAYAAGINTTSLLITGKTFNWELSPASFSPASPSRLVSPETKKADLEHVFDEV